MLRALPRIIKSAVVALHVSLITLQIAIIMYTVHAFLNWDRCRIHLVVGMFLWVALGFAIRILERSDIAMLIRSEICTTKLFRINTRVILVAGLFLLVTFITITWYVAYSNHTIPENYYEACLLAYGATQTSQIETAQQLADFTQGFPTYFGEFYVSTIPQSKFGCNYEHMQRLLIVNVILLIICGCITYILDVHRLFIVDLFRISMMENSENSSDEP